MRMVVDSPAGLTLAAMFVLTTTMMVCGNETTILTLKRTRSYDQLMAIDSTRHGRLLSPVRGPFKFPVEGGSKPIFRLYYTTVKLGTPPKEFNVITDTGSDVFWVSCISCGGCPKTGNVSFFDPEASSSAVKFPCSDKRCYSKKKSGCSPHESCSYI